MDYEKIKTVEDAASAIRVSLALKDRDRLNYVIEQFGDLRIEYLTGIK
jgi:hypothetical protein